MTKAEIIRAGARLGVDYALHRVLLPGGCGRARLRTLRFLPAACRAGSAAAGIADPTRYQPR